MVSNVCINDGDKVITKYTYDYFIELIAFKMKYEKLWKEWQVQNNE